MRSLLLLAALTSTAFANEVIEIHDHIPEPAKPPESVHLRYSDAAIASNAWARAWLLVDIDSSGIVTRAKLLHAPGHDLDTIAIAQAFATRFTPARDRSGRPTPSHMLWGIEWPAYWWSQEHHKSSPHCRGSGPLQLGSLYGSVYRDCSEPDLSRASTAPWIYPRAATTNLR
jgi:hypothetical protein